MPRKKNKAKKIVQQKNKAKKTVQRTPIEVSHLRDSILEDAKTHEWIIQQDDSYYFSDSLTLLDRELSHTDLGDGSQDGIKQAVANLESLGLIEGFSQQKSLLRFYSQYKQTSETRMQRSEGGNATEASAQLDKKAYLVALRNILSIDFLHENN